MSDSSKARLAPLPVERWGEAERRALEVGFPEAAPVFLSGKPEAPPIPNVLGTLMHNPAITAPWLVFNNVLLREPLLGHRRRELLILRVAWRTRAPYEWLQHVRMALALEIPTDQIVAITRGDYAGFDETERLLLEATDELVGDQCLTDATWSALSARLENAQILEVLFTVGAYHALAMVFNSCGIQLDAGLAPPPGVPMPDARG